jgi:flagellar secretion chaperone FliS
MTPDSPSNVYQQMEVASANNLKLVVLLYEGAIRFSTEAKGFIEQRNLAGKARAIDRVFAIVGELHRTLNVDEGGEIAVTLDRLYVYIMERVLEASLKLEVAPLDEAIKLLRVLNSAWTKIAQDADKTSATIVESPTMSTIPLTADQVAMPHRPLEVFA